MFFFFFSKRLFRPFLCKTCKNNPLRSNLAKFLIDLKYQVIASAANPAWALVELATNQGFVFLDRIKTLKDDRPQSCSVHSALHAKKKTSTHFSNTALLRLGYNELLEPECWTLICERKKNVDM